MRLSNWVPAPFCIRSEFLASEWPQGYIPMFTRGRLDQFALNATSEEGFRELRQRVATAGAGDGTVTDIGPILSFTYPEPDGAEHEVTRSKPSVAFERSQTRERWTTVDME